MKAVLTIVAVLLVGILGYSVWSQREAFKEVEAQVLVLEAQKDTAKAVADSIQAEADSVALVLDSLEVVRAEERAAAAARRVRTEVRADSLEQEIVALMPPELVGQEIAEAVMDAVSDIRQEYQGEIEKLNDLLIMTEVTLERSRAQNTRYLQVNENLRQALAASEQQVTVLEGALNPGWLNGLWKEKGPLTVALFVGVGIKTALGG